jgi:hypothetical protein
LCCNMPAWADESDATPVDPLMEFPVEPVRE